MDLPKLRRECPHCKQELARTAYARHQTDRTGRICPGKRVCEDESRERSPNASDLDSTFDFGLDGDEDNGFEDSFSHILGRTEDASESLMSDMDTDDTVSSDGEVWDDMESSEGDDEDVVSSSSVNEIVLGVSFFLTYYHLLYRLSESAIRSLLKFIRHLIHFLAVVTGLELLFSLVNSLPKSMHTIRSNFKGEKFVEYLCMCEVL